MFRLFNKFYSPEDDTTGGGAPLSDDKDDVIKFLGDDEPAEEVLDLTEKKPAKKEGKEETADEDEDLPAEGNEDAEEKDEEDELQALVDETAEPTEEQLELTTPVRRREILSKYPNLFKDFPYLEKAYYREQQFTEILPTIDDAKEAVEKSQTLDRFEKDLMGGNVQTILTAVKDQSPNSFYKIVDDILPTIAKVDERAYHHILGNTIKHTIVAMVQEARKSKNDVLQSAAQVLNQFVFGSSDFVPPSNLSKEENNEKKPDDISEREQALNRRQFESARNDLNTRVNNTLRATIEGHIDPKNSMSDYVKKQAIREVHENLQSLIGQDKRFGTILDKLWEDSFKKGFSRDSTDRIRSAYLSKAKTLLPSVIKKARIEALKGMGKRVREEQDENTPKKGQENKSKPRSEDSGNRTKKGDVPRGMRTLDFLMSD